MPNIPMQIGFNGVIYDEKNGIVTDENGTAKLQINLGYKGAYTFAICFLGDDNHNASFAVAKSVQPIPFISTSLSIVTFTALSPNLGVVG